MNDLFETPDLLPVEVQEILNAAGEVSTYEECEELKSQLNVLGYDFEYYLDAQPFNLHKL